MRILKTGFTIVHPPFLLFQFVTANMVKYAALLISFCMQIFKENLLAVFLLSF